MALSFGVILRCCLREVGAVGLSSFSAETRDTLERISAEWSVERIASFVRCSGSEDCWYRICLAR